MKRRCSFLDNLPAFNFNTGVGKVIVGEDGKRIRTDTRHLGSTLMSTMLKEVGNLCDPAIKKNWTETSHQQVSVRNSFVMHSENYLHFIPPPPPPPFSSSMIFVMEKEVLDFFPFNLSSSQMR